MTEKQTVSLIQFRLFSSIDGHRSILTVGRRLLNVAKNKYLAVLTIARLPCLIEDHVKRVGTTPSFSFLMPHSVFVKDSSGK